MTLLEFAQQVGDEIGLTVPAMLIGSQDLTAKRIVACARAQAQQLYRAHNWSALEREYDFETTAAEENYGLPADFGRLVAHTAWDRALFRRMKGALTGAQWQYQRSATLATAGLTKQFRLIVGPLRGSVLITPVPTASGEVLVYEYVSTDWAESAAGVSQAAWLADGDEFRLDHELFRLGLLWRVKRAVGLPYGDEQAEAEREIKDAIKADMGLDVMNMGPARAPFPWANMPEGGWPG